jgi:twinkle protein
LTGYPGHGKSTFLDDMMINLTKLHGWKFGVFSAENQPITRHLVSLISKFSGFPFGEGPKQRITERDLDFCVSNLDDYFFLLDPDEDKRTISHILEMAGYLVEMHGIDGLVIDPWNEIDFTRSSWMSETEFISKALSQVRFFARRNNVHVWIVAHPAKLYPDKSGAVPKPGLMSICGSSHFRNKADMGLMVWRDENGGCETEIHILKVRFQENGKLGRVKLWFDRSTGKYSDM